MSTPTKIAIGWKNLCLDPGVTFTPSSEHASHDADNLGIAHPSRFWRATSVPTSGAFVDMDFGGVAAPFTSKANAALTAVLYATTEAHRNLLFDGSNLDDWTSANTGSASSAISSVSTAPPTFSANLDAWRFDCQSGTGEFGVKQTFTKPVAAEQHEYQYSGWFREQAGNPNLRLRCQGAAGGTDFVFHNFDLTSGAINGVGSTGGAFSGLSASVLESDGDWHRCEITFTVDTSASVLTRFYVLNSSFSISFTGAGEQVEVIDQYLTRELTLGAGVVTPASSFNTTDNDGVRAPFFRVLTDSVNNFAAPVYDSESLHFASRDSLRMWKTDVGWMHNYHIPATVEGERYARVLVYDSDNVDTQLDISNIYIGPVWNPSFDLHKDFKASVDKFGRRIWDCTFPVLTLDEYENEAEAMALAVGIGELDQTAAGGQDYGENRTPVVVILDPANPSQSQTLYGWIISYSATRISVETGAIRYTVKIRFREVLP